jgi:hypothetical protein
MDSTGRYCEVLTALELSERGRIGCCVVADELVEVQENYRHVLRGIYRVYPDLL